MGMLAIRATQLGKQYRIGGPQLAYTTLRQTVSDVFTTPFRRVRQLLRGDYSSIYALSETLWALKELSFEVRHGEAVGVIGHNGAGKSTLLKILARITEPNEGTIDVYGRIAALLDVGTGFHPELTGRENIHLNAAILGMRRAEINRKFDEIVDFSGVEKFIDTPVKYYSSGMRLRLGFGVAAHLEPEILLLDEVLAVGDAEFQKKCLNKMSDITGEGRTVLFVSHNLAAISRLCAKTLWLSQGTLVDFGPTEAIVGAYVASVSSGEKIDLAQRQDRLGDGSLRVASMTMKNGDGVASDTFQSGAPVTFEIHYTPRMDRPARNIVITIRVYDSFKRLLFTLGTHLTQEITPAERAGVVSCFVPHLLLGLGQYQTEVMVYNNFHLADAVDTASQFTVVEGDFYGGNQIVYSESYGPLLMPQRWYNGNFEEKPLPVQDQL